MHTAEILTKSPKRGTGFTEFDNRAGRSQNARPVLCKKAAAPRQRPQEAPGARIAPNVFLYSPAQKNAPFLDLARGPERAQAGRCTNIPKPGKMHNTPGTVYKFSHTAPGRGLTISFVTVYSTIKQNMPEEPRPGGRVLKSACFHAVLYIRPAAHAFTARALRHSRQSKCLVRSDAGRFSFISHQGPGAGPGGPLLQPLPFGPAAPDPRAQDAQQRTRAHRAPAPGSIRAPELPRILTRSTRWNSPGSRQGGTNPRKKRVQSGHKPRRYYNPNQPSPERAQKRKCPHEKTPENHNSRISRENRRVYTTHAARYPAAAGRKA